MITCIPENTNVYFAKSTDTKPVDDMVPNASIWYQFDDQTVFVFDAETKEWIKQ